MGQDQNPFRKKSSLDSANSARHEDAVEAIPKKVHKGSQSGVGSPNTTKLRHNASIHVRMFRGRLSSGISAKSITLEIVFFQVQFMWGALAATIRSIEEFLGRTVLEPAALGTVNSQ